MWDEEDERESGENGEACGMLAEYETDRDNGRADDGADNNGVDDNNDVGDDSGQTLSTLFVSSALPLVRLMVVAIVLHLVDRPKL